MGWSIFFDGISAFATAGALIAAVAAGVQAKRLYMIESARDEQSKEVARRLHATQISSWAAMQILHGGEPIYGVVVRNSSDDPVYDVRVTCHGFTTEKTPTLRCVPPGEYFVPNRDQRKPNGRFFRWDYVKPVSEIVDPVRPFTASDSRGVDELTFRGNSGVAWSRTARGSLSRT
ncbi:hypothetical protein DEJ05_13020 [Curtobacterium sp. MCLR17_045]|uniref:hypothetical protein n=1 Tax=Curtobacterium sp. MCLR17_045 TaxID=2175629 RepID=UPI000DAA04F4|nr:hypothetical protein [Curtobacterium sp. MCLR17_045]PZF24687.1 hypothetical protein DEJ05_13020 [Curtobacterium sp. MCLR17_045]